MYLARNAPPKTATEVATRCPTIAPPATPHGDCRKEKLCSSNKCAKNKFSSKLMRELNLCSTQSNCSKHWAISPFLTIYRKKLFITHARDLKDKRESMIIHRLKEVLTAKNTMPKDFQRISRGLVSLFVT